MILLQKATRNLLKDTSFINRWVPVTTLKKGLEVRYKFNKTYPLTKLTLSRSINQIEPMIENLEYKHPSGLYRAKFNNESLFFQQNCDLDPPSFFVNKSSTKIETSSSMNEILREDRIFFDNYYNRIVRERDMGRSKKRKRDFFDDVDHILEMSELELKKRK